MRFIVKCKLPVETANAAVKDGTLAKTHGVHGKRET
jgi:hypothetical protein